MHAVRSVVAEYLVMVGVPVCGILMVLTLGRGLVAAPAVDGPWLVELRTGASDALQCLGGGRSSTVLLRIRQSGRYLEALLGRRGTPGRPTLGGSVAGQELTLHGGDRIPGCQTGVSIQARLVDRKSAPRLEGTLTTARGAVAFSARPAPPARVSLPEGR